MILFSNLPYIYSDNDGNILTEENDEDSEEDEKELPAISDEDASEVDEEELETAVAAKDTPAVVALDGAVTSSRSEQDKGHGPPGIAAGS